MSGAGFASPAFRNTLPDNSFGVKRFPGNELGESGCSRLLPVIPGRGGHQPGQKRDKFSAPIFTPMTILGFIVAFSLAVGMVRSDGGTLRRRRGRSSSEDQSTDRDEIAASYARFSSDLQRDESNTDQQRMCREAADQNRHQILPEFEFSDEAVSGTKLRRSGLDALLRAAEAGEFQVLYFHSLSRLSRESVITMPMLKRLVYVFKVRVISVTEGVDSERDGWEVIASIMSLLHERYVKELAANVFRGQEGTVLADFCVGDYRFGYRSVEVPGSEATRKGRNAKPRKVYAIDEETAPWVVRIFHWFVDGRQSIRWITRELNKRGAPKDHRSTTPDWHHSYVVKLLESPKYVGIWPWGESKNTRDPETGKIRQELRSPEEAAKWTREFPHLRIIDDDTFDKAQQYLEENYQKYAANRKSDGTLQGNNGRGIPRHLLSGLIVCGECGAKFQVGGSGGKYMFCPNHHKGTCNCKTQLRRDRAERMILDEIGCRILSSQEWVDIICQAATARWNGHTKQTPAELAAAERALQEVERKISRLVDRIEDGFDDHDVEQRLRQRRDERRAIVKNIDRLKRESSCPQQPPTTNWIRKRLESLGESLNGDCPASALALRELVQQIVVHEIRIPDRQRHFLRGQFTLSTNVVVGAVSNFSASDEEASKLEEFVIDFVELSSLDKDSVRAKELYDQGPLNKDIARQMDCSPGYVTKLLKHWFESRGLEMPDARSRRAFLLHKQSTPPKYQEIAEAVMVLYEQDVLLEDIAAELGCDRNTITKAVKYWHEARDLPVPDGRSRRKRINQRKRES